MIISVKQFLILFSITLLITSCFEFNFDSDKPNELPDNEICTIFAEVLVEYVSHHCSEINHPAGISFGFETGFQLDVDCGIECSRKEVFYSVRTYLQKPDTLIKLPQYFKVFCDCNARENITILFVEEENDPNAIDFEVGDKILIKFEDPGLNILYNGFGMTDTEPYNFDLLDFTFEYALSSEDFDCN